MATKNANSSKVKAKTAKKAPTKVASKAVSKVQKDAAPKPVEKIQPKIMSAKPAEAVAPKKSPKTPKEKVATPASEASDPEWLELLNQSKSTKPVPYSMSEDFQPKTVINHKVLGLGFVLKSQNNRIEVQFRDGKKTLITNYKK